jgi:hypothetical protein
VHTVQTSRYHPAALVERGYGVETQSSVGHMPRQPTVLATYRYTASAPDNDHDLLQWVMQNDTRESQKFVANCLTGSRRKILYEQSCLQQTINKLHKVITYSLLRASSKTLVSILQRVIRRDKHPYYVIRIDRPSYCGCAHNVLCKTFRLHDEL